MNINLNINEDGIKELQKKINEITEISKKYASMGYKKSDNINFRNPKDEVEEAFVKKINYGVNWLELESINPYYPARRFENSDISRVQVLGVVKEVTKYL